VPDVPEDSSIEWEAAQWVARRMGDQPFDKDGFDAWLAGDPRRKVLFEAMWPRIMGSRMDETLDAVIRQRRRSKRSLVVSAVATALAVLGGYQALPSVELFLSRPQEYAAAGGTLREITLEDGTQLTLAGGTGIRVRYARHAREIELMRGTIFANVTHDETRPFRIDTGGARTTDLGTRFEVSSKPSFVRVTVEAGAVRFGADGWFSKQLDLTAGQAAVLSAAELGRMENVTRDGVARWRTEWVEYHDAPIGQVVADLESVSTLPIRIAPGSLVELRVSGRIRLTDPMRQINNLSIIHNFSVEQRDSAIILTDHK
jgi:transmembrane sensor